jgi:plasmid stabilization system protein ParE
MRVRFAAAARIELDEILAHISADNPVAATGVAGAIRAAAGKLGSFPRIGSATNDPKILIQIANPYRYLIFYSIEPDAVIIRRVRHPARRRSADERL